jgi:hypothetical protein
MSAKSDISVHGRIGRIGRLTAMIIKKQKSRTGGQEGGKASGCLAF